MKPPAAHDDATITTRQPQTTQRSSRKSTKPRNGTSESDHQDTRSKQRSRPENSAVRCAKIHESERNEGVAGSGSVTSHRSGAPGPAARTEILIQRRSTRRDRITQCCKASDISDVTDRWTLGATGSRKYRATPRAAASSSYQNHVTKVRMRESRLAEVNTAAKTTVVGSRRAQRAPTRCTTSSDEEVEIPSRTRYVAPPSSWSLIIWYGCRT